MPMQMIITVEDNGNVSVRGPIENMAMAYGLLEVARDAIQTHHAKQNAARIRPPSESDILQLRKVHQ